MKSVDKGVIFFNDIINDTHMEELYFIQFNWLAASDLFDMFPQSKFLLYIPPSLIKSTDV